MKKYVLFLLMLLLTIIQWFPPDQNVPPAMPNHALTSIYAVPADVEGLLQRACYDCHSNETRYPWYSHVQPVGWWLQKHVDEGRHELNFSVFGTYQLEDHDPIFGAIAELVHEGRMPLGSYLWAHPEARLTQHELDKIVTWAQEMSDSLSAVE